MTERDLLLAYKNAKIALDTVKEQAKAAQIVCDQAETALIEHLTAAGAEATAKYQDVGYAKVMKPRLYASCLKEHEDWLKDYLRKHDRADMIREVVPAPCLSSYVGELVEQGKAIPEKIGYYLKTSVRLF